MGRNNPGSGGRPSSLKEGRSLRDSMQADLAHETQRTSDRRRESPYRPEHQLKLPFRFWVPTIGSVALVAVSFAWWFHGVISPMQQNIAALQWSAGANVSDTEMFPFEYFMEGVDTLHMSLLHQRRIANAATMLQERRDLVAIIAGYTDSESGMLVTKQNSQSETAARLVRNALLQQGIAPERIFARGYGLRVPGNFPHTKRLNVAIMLCDVYVVMRNATY